jgi:hypothetical protein
MMWRCAFGVLCVQYISIRLKAIFYRAAVTLAMLYATKWWAIKEQRAQKMSVAEMKM